MKKLLFLLFPIFSYGQVTITKVTSSGEATCSGAGIVSVVHNNIALTTDKLYIAVVFADSTNSYGTAPTGTSFTWDIVSQSGNNTRRISIYKTLPTSSTTTEDPTVTFSFGSFPNFIGFHIYEITGIVLGNNGNDAVIQAVTNSATGADPNVTLAALGRSAVISFFSNDRDIFAGAPESGFTENIDNGCTTYPASSFINGHYVMYDASTNDNTPTVTSASSTWIGAALEIRASGRRAVIIN
jgi:hypothetical protein